jgi:multidrug efflux system outer membrane protein
VPSRSRPATLLLLITALTGCSLAPHEPLPAIALPADWNDPVIGQDAAPPMADWWRRFGDPALDALVAQALEYNLDLALAAARIEEARAQLGASRAEQWPTLDAQADASRQRSASGNGSLGNAGVRELYSVAGVLGYELDLFGRLRSATDAARARLLESTYTADALHLTVATDVVSAYLDLRATERQLAITDASVQSRQEALRLQRARLRLGADTELTLRQAEAALAAARAQAASLRENLGRTQTALAVLSGASPQALFDGQPQPGQFATLDLPGEFPRVLPAQLLERRPDIRAAQAALRAADADIGAARALWFPRINLTALIGSDALRVGDLFSGPAASWSLGSSLVAPLLDFGRAEAQVAGAQARRAQSQALYRQTVQTAFREVRDALTTLREAQARQQAQTDAVTALSRARELASLQYLSGRGLYLDVLDADRSLLTAQLDLTAAARDARVAAATLHKALGGDWPAPAPS